MTYNEAVASLPRDCQWICSFGNPGVGGYSECYRDLDCAHYRIANGSYLDSAPFTWTVRED
jgi:hypothetical protein